MTPDHAEGTITGWEPVYRENPTHPWKEIPVKNTNDAAGIPAPSLHGSLLHAAGLYGPAQARALAWQFLALHEAYSQPIAIQIGLRQRSLKYTFQIYYDGVSELN
jgi:hypothetical protein